MSYKIVFQPAARQALRRLPKDLQQALGRQISALADDVHPPESRKLEGITNCYRPRHGDYRVVYTVLEDCVVVLILRVGHRSEVYRNIGDLTQQIRRRRRPT